LQGLPMVICVFNYFCLKNSGNSGVRHAKRYIEIFTGVAYRRRQKQRTKRIDSRRALPGEIRVLQVFFNLFSLAA